jgi:hypothetical protein
MGIATLCGSTVEEGWANRIAGAELLRTVNVIQRCDRIPNFCGKWLVNAVAAMNRSAERIAN